jgi:hypothetical protein
MSDHLPHCDKISKELLLDYAVRWLPVVSRDGKYFLPKMNDGPYLVASFDRLRNVAFNMMDDLIPVVISAWGPEITTYHNFGAPSYFKPSVHEVLSHITNPEIYSDYNGFIVSDPNLYSVRQKDRMNPDTNLRTGDWHSATTTFVKYRMK